MSKKKDFEERYKTGDLPWDTGSRDKYLEEVIKDLSLQPCSVLELGAGTGSDAVWLTKQGFSVTAVDVSSTAVEMARGKASEEGVNIDFIVADILKDDIPSGSFDFVFDRGCFHIFDPPEERERLAEFIWHHLLPGGYWFSIIGSTDGPMLEEGPPRRSVLDIASAVESRFEVISLKSIELDTNLPKPPRGWACLMRRRKPENAEARKKEVTNEQVYNNS
jgi:SAM-dependent methyltransferase